MDGLRQLRAQQQRELEALELQCEERLAAALRAPAKLPHFVQLRRLHSTLTRQRRHLEALEVLRTLESLEWREEESQRERVQLENEAQLEALLKRHQQERQLLEEHALRLQLNAGAADLASGSWGASPRPPPRHLHHRQLRPEPSPRAAVANLAPSSRSRGSSDWGLAAAGRQRAPHHPPSPSSTAGGLRRGNVWAADDFGHRYLEQASEPWDPGLDKCPPGSMAASWECGSAPGGMYRPGSTLSGAASRPTTAASIWSAPAAAASNGLSVGQPQRRSYFSVDMGYTLGSAAAGIGSAPAEQTCVPQTGRGEAPPAAPPPPAQEEGPEQQAGMAPVQGLNTGFDAADWDVLATLQLAAEQSLEGRLQPPHTASSWGCGNHLPPQLQPHGRTPPRQQHESPLAQRLAQLRCSPAGRELQMGPAGQGAEQRAIGSRGGRILPSIHSPASRHQMPDHPAQAQKGSWHGSDAGPLSAGITQRAPDPVAVAAWDRCQELLPQLLSLLLSAPTATAVTASAAAPAAAPQLPQPIQPGSPSAETQQGCALGSMVAGEVRAAAQPVGVAPAAQAPSSSGSPHVPALAATEQGAPRPCSLPRMASLCQLAADILHVPAAPSPTALQNSQAVQHLPACQMTEQAAPEPPHRVGPVIQPASAEGTCELPAVACQEPAAEDQVAAQPEPPPGHGELDPAAAVQAAVAALHDHCRHGRYEEVRQVLREAAIPIDARDLQGNTPLMLACAGGHGRLVKLCLRKGAAVDAQNAAGETALVLAAAAGHRAVVRHLLQVGADPTLGGQQGRSAEELILQWGGAAAPD